jgi:hypothetical protein
MNYGGISFLLTLVLFAGMLALLVLGRRYGRRGQDDGERGIGPVNAAIFGLMGLMVAFTFQGAAQRFDERRDQIVDEANAIGTAWLRVDLLPEADQPAMRDLFRAYADARIAAYRALPDEAAFQREFDRATQLQKEIWKAAITATRAQAPATPNTAAMLLLPALNAMIDVTTLRTMALLKHPPDIVYVVLCALALASSLLAGHAMAGRQRASFLHLVGYPVIVAVVVMLVVNLEHPRLGLIPIDAFDIAIANVRDQMN